MGLGILYMIIIIPIFINNIKGKINNLGIVKGKLENLQNLISIILMLMSKNHLLGNFLMI
jgi:hypothetical protein